VKAGGGLLSIVRTAREGDKPWRRSSSSTGRIYGLTRSPRNENHFTGFGFTRLWNPLPA
jgi:hypothetical protein